MLLARRVTVRPLVMVLSSLSVSQLMKLSCSSIILTEAFSGSVIALNRRVTFPTFTDITFEGRNASTQDQFKLVPDDLGMYQVTCVALFPCMLVTAGTIWPAVAQLLK